MVTTVSRTTVSFWRRMASTSRKLPMSCSSSRMLAVERVEIEVLPRHAIELARLRLVGDLVEPVAVLEAQEVLQRVADVAPEDAVGLRVGDVEPADGGDQPVGEHVQRRFLEVRDRKSRKC